jgi:hypothetical protein
VWRRLRDERGASTASFVILFPLFLFMFMGLVQWGLYFHARNQVAAAAQKGLEGDSQSAQTLRKLGMTGAISGAALLDTVHGESSLLRKTMADAGISVGR